MKVLDWRTENDWLSELSNYAGDLLGNELLEEIRENGIKGCWSDDMSWLPGKDIDKEVEARFVDYYSHVKAFHGCRPLTVRSYYESGILGQNRGKITEQFKSVFSDVDDALLEEAIRDLEDRGHREDGKVYFVCDDQDLIESCGHYLIQGSEYIMAMATSLYRLSGRQEDYRLRLREIGIPTVFEVDIPLEVIPNYQISEVVGAILATWGTLNLFPDDYYKQDMSFVIHDDLPPRCIIGHSHPEKILDPHFGNSWYRFSDLCCDVCRSGL